jgi:alkylation response protein AidB-like acyl-CoA dehydrogenase
VDLSYTQEQQEFRKEVRVFLAENLPSRISEKVRLGKRLVKGDTQEWSAMLNARGWLAANWPKQYGGAEWDAVQRQIFEEETCLASR